MASNKQLSIMNAKEDTGISDMSSCEESTLEPEVKVKSLANLKQSVQTEYDPDNPGDKLSVEQGDEHRDLEFQQEELEQTIQRKIDGMIPELEERWNMTDANLKVLKLEEKLNTTLDTIASRLSMLEDGRGRVKENQRQDNRSQGVVRQTTNGNKQEGDIIYHWAEFKELCDDLEITPVPQKVELAFGPALGKGGFGRVYRVSGFPNQKVCSAKALFDNIALEKKQEIMILRNCNSKYILKLYTICQVPDLTKSKVLIMELMEGDLESYFSASKQNTSSAELSNKSIIGILIQVARGLDYLHSFQPKIIHRDLTARNVLLCNIKDEIPLAKIGDFGLARFVDSMESVATMTGVAGTKYYLAPEVDDRGHKCNEKIDIFSFGHLMLSACIRQVINDLPNVREVKDEIERRKVPFECLKDGQEEIEPIIKSCLQYPDFRSRPSAKDLIKSLMRIEEALQTPTNPPEDLPTSTM